MTKNRKMIIMEKLTSARSKLLDLVSTFGESEWSVIAYSEGQEWTVADILRHLVSAEASMTRLSELIRDGGEGVPTDFDLQRWNARGIQKAGDKVPGELMEEMISNRARLFEFINKLDGDDWSKSGRHGSLRVMTIEEILNLIADHEFRHTQDMQEAVSR